MCDFFALGSKQLLFLMIYEMYYKFKIQSLYHIIEQFNFFQQYKYISAPNIKIIHQARQWFFLVKPWNTDKEKVDKSISLQQIMNLPYSKGNT